MISPPKKFVRQLQAGDRATWAAFVDEYGGRIHQLARRFAATEADADDMTQEIFVQLSRSLGGFRGECALGTWVYRVAWNQCCRWQKAHADESTVLLEETVVSVEREADPQGQAMHGELAAQIGAALGTLSEGHRDVVVLHEMHGLTYAECAQVLNIPVGTVKSRLSNAFGRLRERLRPYVQDQEAMTESTSNRTTAAFSDAIGGQA